jgi:hypothetical protein
MRQKKHGGDWRDMRERLGNLWREKREQNQKSLKEVAAWLTDRGFIISFNGISRFERGVSEPLDCQIFIRMLCILYNIKPNDILATELFKKKVDNTR